MGQRGEEPSKEQDEAAKRLDQLREVRDKPFSFSGGTNLFLLSLGRQCTDPTSPDFRCRKSETIDDERLVLSHW
jgi:hypothetical protein